MKKLHSLTPLHYFILLMIAGALLTLNSYELGIHTGTQEIVLDRGDGTKSHMWDIDDKKIDASTEAYQKVGCMLLLIGGIGLVSIWTKPTS